MNETAATLDVEGAGISQLQSIITKVANLGQVPSSEEHTLLYAAHTLSTKCDVLLKVKHTDSNVTLSVNSEKIVIGSMLVKDLKTALTSHS